MKQGAGFLLLCPSTKHILTVLRTKPKTAWSIFGGSLEKYEKPIQCAKRELLEEAGFIENDDYKIISLRPINIGHYTKFIYRTYLAITKSEILPKLNYEHSQFKWVSLDEIPEPHHFGIVQLLQDKKCVKKIESLYELE